MFTLYGLVQGDNTVFDVTVSADECVSGLKKLIYEEGKNGILHGTDAKDMSLWVSKPIPIAPINTLSERVASLGTELSRFAVEMDEPADEVSRYLPGNPLKGHLYIIVRAPNADTSYSARSPRSSIDVKLSHPDPAPQHMEQYIPREETVRGLYDKLMKDKYIQVRGGPGSGKTNLAKLLHKYIMDNEPDPWVTYVHEWLPQGKMPPGGWRKWLSPRWDFQPNSVLIVDEAQSSYWDKTFWLELKQIKPESRFRVITFASYGSAGINIYDPSTPFRISPRQNISLFALDHGDGIAVGLLLTKPEFEDLVAKLFVNHNFDVSCLDSVFDITCGHVGACKDFLNIVCGLESYKSLKSTGKRYTVDDFMTSIHMAELLEALSSTSSFSTGLPKASDLQDTSLVKVLRDVLLTGSLVSDRSSDELSVATVKSPLRRCFESGWLHNELISPTQVAYTFASPLHKRYVQRTLLATLPANGSESLDPGSVLCV